MASVTEVASARSLVAHDWLVTRAWNRLHFADLTFEQLAEMYDWRQLDGTFTLACGRTATYVSIPGLFTRMGAERCRRCCSALGYPQGKGSPKNDDGCRKLLGLPESEPGGLVSSPSREPTNPAPEGAR